MYSDHILIYFQLPDTDGDQEPGGHPLLVLHPGGQVVQGGQAGQQTLPGLDQVGNIG